MQSKFPDQLQFNSEHIEATISYIIGKMFARSQHTKETYGKESLEYIDSLQNWWWAMRKISQLLVVCDGATHAQVAHTNMMKRLRSSIEFELGITLSFVGGDELNFRELVMNKGKSCT